MDSLCQPDTETNRMSLNAETAVKDRYKAGAEVREAQLCCPVQYNPELLKVIPKEVIEKDYGCGDPSQYLNPGETVLDLGSGTGKICFIASQVVGAEGRVIGVDMTDEMLDVARRNAPVVAEEIGYANVEFRKGRIQDLALDLDKLDEELKRAPIDGADSFLAADALAEDLRIKSPLIPDNSIDVVVSNCVLNLVEPKSKKKLFGEVFRVLRRGGRVVISDIVADEPVPQHLQDDAELWSGCISGALTEEEFLQAFADSGFYGIEILKLDQQPWRTVEGIEFRSMTIQAFKGKQGPCFERNQAVIYRGPFAEVLDDDGHRMKRGMRYAVCDKTYNLYKRAPYSAYFEFVDPRRTVSAEEAKPFDCKRTERRDPRETKGSEYKATTPAEPGECCDAGGCC